MNSDTGFENLYDKKPESATATVFNKDKTNPLLAVKTIITTATTPKTISKIYFSIMSTSVTQFNFGVTVRKTS